MLDPIRPQHGFVNLFLTQAKPFTEIIYTFAKKDLILQRREISSLTQCFSDFSNVAR
jgi:hypothetical protein